MTELVGGYGTKAGASKNLWLLHLATFRKANPNVKNVLQEAKKTYTKKGVARAPEGITPAQQSSNLAMSVLTNPDLMKKINEFKPAPKPKVKKNLTFDEEKYRLIFPAKTSILQQKNWTKLTANEENFYKEGSYFRYMYEGLNEAISMKDKRYAKNSYDNLMKYVKKYGRYAGNF
jgi:hypothetical protein